MEMRNILSHEIFPVLTSMCHSLQSCWHCLLVEVISLGAQWCRFQAHALMTATTSRVSLMGRKLRECLSAQQWLCVFLHPWWQAGGLPFQLVVRSGRSIRPQGTAEFFSCKHVQNYVLPISFILLYAFISASQHIHWTNHSHWTNRSHLTIQANWSNSRSHSHWSHWTNQSHWTNGSN